MVKVLDDTRIVNANGKTIYRRHAEMNEDGSLSIDVNVDSGTYNVDSGNRFVVEHGTQFNDTIIGASDSEIHAYGGAGNDYIFLKKLWGGGSSISYGGDGDDHIVHDGVSSGAGTKLYGEAGNDILEDRGGDEALIWGGDGDDVILGHNMSYGDAGNDRIRGGWWAEGDAGDDIITDIDAAGGGSGDDVIVSGTTMWLYLPVDGGEGDDLLITNVANNFSTMNSAVVGGSGSDVFAPQFDKYINGDRAAQFILEIGDFEVGVDKIALAFDYQVVDHFTGKAGEIIVRDTGPRNSFPDYFMGDSSQSIFIDTDGSGAADATLRLVNVSGPLIDGRSFLRLSPVGTERQDVLKGTSSDELLYGAEGDDEVRGGGGGDRILGSWGRDALYGDDGDDFISGGVAEDRLSGGLGSDRLIGGDGDDTISGGRGKDVLVGGSGRDVFTFENLDSRPGGGARDVISDFKVGEDKIDLRALGITSEAQLTFKTTGGGMVVYGDITGNGFDWFDFGVSLTGVRSLDGSSFIFD